MSLQIDTSKTGLEMFFKPWQIQALDHLQTIRPQGANSGAVHRAVHKKYNIARSSIFNFLNFCVDEGFLAATSTTCRGGYQRIFTLTITEKGLLEHLTEETLRFLMKEFPEATKNVMPDMFAMMKRLGR